MCEMCVNTIRETLAKYYVMKLLKIKLISHGVVFAADQGYRIRFVQYSFRSGGGRNAHYTKDMHYIDLVNEAADRIMQIIKTSAMCNGYYLPWAKTTVP